MPGPEAGTTGQGPVVGPTTAGGSSTSGPLVLKGHQTGEAIRTNWDAVTPTEGGGGGHYQHTQTVPQSVVTITHSLGFRPAGVSLFSLDLGTKYRGYGVQHMDENTVRISMDRPTPFVAVLS